LVETNPFQKVETGEDLSIAGFLFSLFDCFQILFFARQFRAVRQSG
jgi:hypothetical protein